MTAVNSISNLGDNSQHKEYLLITSLISAEKTLKEEARRSETLVRWIRSLLIDVLVVAKKGVVDRKHGGCFFGRRRRAGGIVIVYNEWTDTFRTQEENCLCRFK